MSRRKKIYRKKAISDARYDSELVASLINKLIRCGKKSLAEKIVYQTIDNVNKEFNTVDPLEVLKRAIENVRPQVEVKSKRFGGATYQVPIEILPARSEALAIRWIISFARSRKGHSMIDALTQEIKDAANNQGNAARKRDDIHKMAKANRAFAHLSW